MASLLIRQGVAPQAFRACTRTVLPRRGIAILTAPAPAAPQGATTVRLCVGKNAGPSPWLVRGYARQGGSRFSRPTKTTYAEAEQQQQQQQQQWGAPPAQSAQQQQLGYKQEEEEDRERAWEAVDRSDGLKQHLAQVYGILGGTIGVASLGSVASFVTPLGMIHPLVPMLGSFVPLIWLSRTSPYTDSAMKRGILMSSFGFLSGMSLAPIVGMAQAINPMIVPMSLVATTGMFGVMSAAALMAPKGNFQKFGAPLTGGLFCLIGVSVAGMFYPESAALHSVSLYGGLGLFSLFITYDTQRMIHEYEHGERDAVQGALSMFINLKAVFRSFLVIFMGNED